MPGRKYDAGSGYRYGFNGKENDNEVKGEGNQQDYGMRIYDPGLGKFLSVDPITADYPELTPYQFASNTPIQAIDLDGLESCLAQKNENARDTRTPAQKTADWLFKTSLEQKLSDIVGGDDLNTVFNGLQNPSEAQTVKFWGAFLRTASLFAGPELVSTKAAPAFKVERAQVVVAKTETKTAQAAATNTEAKASGWPLKGSGTVSGVIELNSSTKSSKAFSNGLSTTARDFVYDPTTQKFAMAGKGAAYLKHYGLRQVIGATEANVVGGRIKLGANGEILTSQWSGTYGGNWTSEIANKFKEFIKNISTKEVQHSGTSTFTDETL